MEACSWAEFPEVQQVMANHTSSVLDIMKSNFKTAAGRKSYAHIQSCWAFYKDNIELTN